MSFSFLLLFGHSSAPGTTRGRPSSSSASSNPGLRACQPGKPAPAACRFDRPAHATGGTLLPGEAHSEAGISYAGKSLHAEGYCAAFSKTESNVAGKFEKWQRGKRNPDIQSSFSLLHNQNSRTKWSKFQKDISASAYLNGMMKRGNRENQVCTSLKVWSTPVWWCVKRTLNGR